MGQNEYDDIIHLKSKQSKLKPVHQKSKYILPKIKTIHATFKH